MIDLKTLTDKDIFNVGTEEDYKKLCELLDAAGLTWCTDHSYLNYHSYEYMKTDGYTHLRPSQGTRTNKDNLNTFGSPVRILTLADILQSTPSTSSSFQTLFPFNL